VYKRQIHGTTHERPLDRFETEKTSLHPLPSPEFDCSIIEPVQSTRQALIHFDSNRYSVPHRCASRALTVVAHKHEIEIFSDEGRSLARHARCYEKYRVIENPAHFEGLLAERKKARATKRVAWFLSLAPECEAYLKGLVATELVVAAHLEKIHDLALHYGQAELMSAVLHALSYKAFGADYLERIIHQSRAARNMPEPQPISLIKKPEWTKVTVEQTDLSLYDELFEREEPDEGN